MRRRLAESLAVILSVASLGAGAASGPSSLEAAKVTQPPVKTGRHKTSKIQQPKSKSIKKGYQVGTASWYGEQFQGKQTASGEPFDMRDFTAAHPSTAAGHVGKGHQPERTARQWWFVSMTGVPLWTAGSSTFPTTPHASGLQRARRADGPLDLYQPTELPQRRWHCCNP
jgi:hypothetical protein